MSINLDPFLDSFFEESAEQIAALESGLLRFESGEGAELVDDLFRATHTLKGNAATFGFRDLVSVTHRLETILDRARENCGALDAEAVEVMLATVDGVREMMVRLRTRDPLPGQRTARLVERLQQVIEGITSAPVNPSPPTSPAIGWAIQFLPHQSLMARGNDPVLIFRALERLGVLRVEADVSALPSLGAMHPATCYIRWRLTLEGDIPRDLVEEVFEWVADDCELVIAPLFAPRPAARRFAPPALALALDDSAEAPVVPVAAGRGREAVDDEVRTGGAADLNAVRIAVDKVDRLINLVGQLAVTQSVLDRAVEALPEALRATLRDGLDDLSRHAHDLQESVLEIRMLPLSFVCRRLPRVVRDLSRALGKEVDLHVYGEETELDKSVLEQISDPLVHIVRNCIDHGMEPPQARRAAGKPQRGTVEVRAMHQQGRVVIEIADDGPGIDCHKVLAAARKRGVPGLSDDMPRERILDLVFHPGLSTADSVSEVSGRGVGLDVVRQNVYALGGTLTVESLPGVGTRFTLQLPLTLAIIDGQFVRVGEDTLVLPLVSIVESMPLDSTALRTMAGQRVLYRFRDDYIPVERLDHLLGLNGVPCGEGAIVVVVGWGSGLHALVVDGLLEQHQVVVKSLERNFRNLGGLLGATVLGDGTVGLIVDVAGLMRFDSVDLMRAAEAAGCTRFTQVERPAAEVH